MISAFGGRRGCDDFQFDRYVPDVAYRRDVERRFHTYNGDPEHYDSQHEYAVEHAWLLAAFYCEAVYEPEKLDLWEFRLVAALLRHGAIAFWWQGSALSEDTANIMRRIANMIWTEDEAILNQE
jgi:hypothetical protein